jgi:hypothetical protein
MDEILYVGFYADPDDNIEKRNCSLAAVNLMNYIAGAVSESRRVTIVSPSWTLSGTGRYGSNKRPLSANISLQTCPTIGFSSIPSKALVYLISQVWLFFYLLGHASRRTTVMVYHSPWLVLPVVLSKYLKRFRLVLQVCEIYQDASATGFLMRHAERWMIAEADRYLLSTAILNSRVNRKNKPFSVCGGVYRPEKAMCVPSDDGRVHLVYSGIIDQVKRGAFTAVRVAEHLDDTYRTHIIGFGRQEDIAALRALIEVVNQKKGGVAVTYEGIKLGAEFNRFLQRCHIGYSTQSPGRDFNASSFPAKIFSYLTNRLRVVSISTEAIRASEASSVIHFYYHDDPGEIADVVRGVDLTSVVREADLVGRLHEDFVRDISRLVKFDDIAGVA